MINSLCLIAIYLIILINRLILKFLKKFYCYNFNLYGNLKRIEN